ncbi:hemerythrin domain-containing protein [Idiomarina sp.]|uniref:hemerythrin domain-containing protein n=1 Tax=Idiomarina sp. TaxID=1874361 RepID=UPI001D45D947|nr:hemerythrin domain-containing protein [Idiomarina sp.]MCJ8316936.1 hemerythrin domain-containing protein [Idiomarina sp.]NQZ16626.1 hemerythrin domain-containing protein [Idiomarina sp.]
MTIFEELRVDHDKQRQLLDLLLDTSGNEPEREQYYQQLKTQLEQHAAAEERYFYNPLIEDNATIEMSRHGIAEHHEIDELIEALEQTDMSSPAWLQHFKNLKHKVLHHLEDEEQGFFQKAGKVLGGSEKQSLGKEYREMMKEKGL